METSLISNSVGIPRQETNEEGEKVALKYEINQQQWREETTSPPF